MRQFLAGAGVACTAVAVYHLLRRYLPPAQLDAEVQEAAEDAKEQHSIRIASSLTVAPTKRRRVAVYGGAFDPITNGHLQLSTEIIHSGQVDEMWICPSGPRPDKPSLSSPGYRCAMAEIAVNQGVAPSFPILVVDHEVKEAATLAGADGSVATYDSLRYLAEKHRDCEISFVIGSDWLRPGTDIRKWTSKEGTTGEQLLNEFDFLVLPRPGYEVEELSAFGPRMKWLALPGAFQMAESNAASTEVRKRAKQEWKDDPLRGRSMLALNGLVQPGVLAFILRNELYKAAGSAAAAAPAPSAKRTKRTKRTNVGLLGGAFSPITNTHMQLASEVVISGMVDEVWIVPCGPRPDKPSLKVSAQQRYIMCCLAVFTTLSPDFPVRVSDHEVTHGAMATYDSLCWLAQTFPLHDFSWVIGSDWLQPGTDIRQWESKEGKTGDQLLNEFDFLVAPRTGYDVDRPLSDFGPRFKWMALPNGFTLAESNASSTEVRQRAKYTYGRHLGRGNAGIMALVAMDGLVPPAVLAYIIRHQLYKDLAYKETFRKAIEKVGRGAGSEKVALAKP